MLIAAILLETNWHMLVAAILLETNWHMLIAAMFVETNWHPMGQVIATMLAIFTFTRSDLCYISEPPG